MVCIHDPDTSRTCGENLLVAGSTLDELRSVDVGGWLSPDWAGTRIPTLDEVLATVPPGRKIFLELKTGPEIVAPLLAGLRRSPLDDRQIAILSFQPEVLAAVRRLAPTLALHWLVAFGNQPRQAPAGNWASILDVLATTGATGLGTNDHPGLSRDLLARLDAAGVTHHAWTIDNPAAARRLLALGTRSITTNRPAALRHALRLEDPN